MDDIKIRLALDGADQVNAGAKKAAEGLGALGAAGQKAAQQGQLTGYQLQQVSAQLQDLFVQIQGGQAPLTALLQQGSQLSAVFGGAGSALRAVAGFLGTIVTPLTGVAAAVAALGLAWKQGSDETVAYSRALILTGNAAGVTIGQLKSLAAAQSQVVGTQGAAAEALAALAATGQITSAGLNSAAEAATRLARVGVPLQDTVKKFAELGRDPLKALVELNQAENFLTEAVYKQVRALVEQGKAQEASVAAQRAYAEVGIKRAKDLEASLGTLETAWKKVGDTAKGAWDRMLNVGRPQTLEEQLDKALKDMDELAAKHAQQARPALGRPITSDAEIDAAYKKRAEAQQTIIADIREQLKLQSRMSMSLNENNQLEQARIKWLQEGQKYLTKEQQAQIEINAIRRQGLEAGAKQAEIEARVAAVRAKYANTGGDNELADLRAKLKETNDYISALNRQETVVRELNDGERAALRIREQLKETLSSTVRAEKERALALATQLGQRQRLASSLKEDIDQGARFVDSVSQQADAIREKAAQQEAANATLGVSRTAVEAMTLAEAKRQAQDLEATDNVNPKYLAGLYAKIEAQERFVKALREGDFKQLNQGLDEWMRSATEQKRLFEDEQQLVGLTRLERDKVVAARQVELKLAKELAKIDQSDLSEAQKDVLRIKAREAAEIESSSAVAKVVRDDWTRTSDYIEQSLTDALMNGGKSGADYIKGLFRSLVLQPTLSNLVSPFAGQVSGAVNGLFNPALSSANAAGGLSSFAGFGQFLSSINGGLGSLGLSAVNSSLGQALGLSSVQNIGGNLIAGPTGAGNFMLNNGGDILGYGNALYSLSQGKYGQAAGSALGTYFGGPIGSAIGSAIGGAIDKAFGSVGANQRGASYLSDGITGMAVTNGGYGLDRAWGDSIGRYFSKDVQTALQSITGTAAGLLNTVATSFGGQAGYQVGAFYASDATRPSQGNYSVLQNGQVLSSSSRNNYDADPTKGLNQLTSALAGQVRDALGMVNIPGWAREQLQKLTGDVSFEQLASTVQSIIATQQALKSLGDAMPQLANLTDAAVSGLLKAFDGIDSLRSAASAYYENFYSEAERNASATKQLGDAISALGLQVPTTREAYRALVEAQNLNTESGRAAYAQLLKLSPAFAALVPATQQLADTTSAAAQQMVEAGRRALAELATDNGSLQVELLKAQGNTVAAAALARQQAIAKLTNGLSAQDAAAATAAYDLNAALRQQIDTLNAAAAAAQQAAQAETQRTAAIAGQRDQIQARIDELLGDTGALRARELAGLDATNRALQERYYALLDEQSATQASARAAEEAAARLAAVASQRENIQARIDELLGNTAAQRSRELAGLDETNRALQLRYYALLDEKTAAEAAAQAAQTLAAKQAAVAAQADGIQARIDDLQGNTAAIRARELAALDESNRALQQHYYDLLDAKTAQDAANRAAQEAARVADQQAQAAQRLRDAWQSVSGTLLEEAQRLLGIGGADTALSRAQAESRFAITTAQARAGDQDAAKLLPSLSRTLEQLIGNTATSRTELDRARAQIAASLRGTAGVLGGVFGLSTQSSSTSVDVQALLSQVAAASPITSSAAAQQQAVAAQQSNLAVLVDEVRGLRAEVQDMKTNTGRTAAASEKTRDLINTVTEGGRAIQTEAYS